MAFIAVPQTARFDCVMDFAGVGGQAGGEAMVSFYVRDTVSPWTAVALAAEATAIGNAYRDFFGPFASTSWTFDRVDGRDLATEFGATATVEYNEAGTTAAEIYSTMAAVLVTKHGSNVGAPRRGRVFVPGLAEVHVVGNDVADAVVADVAEGIDTVRGASVSASRQPVIVSRFNNKVARNPAVTNVWESTSARTLIAVQRNRRD